MREGSAGQVKAHEWRPEAWSIGESAVSSIKVLHLEDSGLDAELIGNRLKKDALHLDILRVVGHDDYQKALATARFDVILADYSLPGFDGLSALRIAREVAPDTPFLFVSGVLGEEVAIETLKQGATDYVLKHRLDRLGPAVRRALTEARERVERRKAEAALRQSERMHRLTLDSVKDYAILTIDTDGRIATSNAGAASVLGYREDDLVGQPTRILFTPEDVAADLPRRELSRAGARGSGDDERWYVRKDGSTFWGSGLVTPLLDEGGRLRGYTKVVRDMTERKRAEEALLEADRRKDEFLAMLAHELRNPLSAINNAAELSRHREISPDQVEWTREIISNQVKHLTRLVDDLLDVSRITLRKVRLKPEPVDLAAILSRAVEATAPSFAGRGHDLRFDPGPGSLPIEGDPTRLEQVFVNLLTNAGKYTEPGGTIALSAAREGDAMVVRVRDNGVGIDPEMLARVFDLFAQVDRSLDRTQGGLGIGLTIARRLVELHGGTIEVASDGPGLGSEFTVRLPATRASGLPQPQARPDRPARSARPGCRVLVVDDNRASAGVLAELLKLSGYDVRKVHDGREAIAEVHVRRPEIVLLDIGLPDMDGYQVAEHLRRQEGLKDLTIIAITGYGEEQAQRRSREAGFDYHLVKPVDYEVLLELLDSRAGPAAA